MFESWSIRKIIVLFLSLILCVGVIQVLMFIYSRSIYIHFVLSFIALFLALMLFHTVNIRLKRARKNK
jgi:ABC-type nickel/cobalt efflux system permease component RcnA